MDAPNLGSSLATMGKKKGSRRDEDDPFADLGEDVSQNNEKAAQEAEIPGYLQQQRL